MPSKLTEKIKDGMTFKEFVIKCASTYYPPVGKPIQSANNDLPETEADPYHLNELSKARDALAKLRAMSNEEIAEWYEKKYEKDAKTFIKESERLEKLQMNYLEIIDELNKWKPSSVLHISFKAFMRKHLMESATADCNPDLLVSPTKCDPLKAHQTEIERLEEDIQYHELRYKIEVEKTTERNQWIRQLLADL